MYLQHAALMATLLAATHPAVSLPDFSLFI